QQSRSLRGTSILSSGAGSSNAGNTNNNITSSSNKEVDGKVQQLDGLTGAREGGLTLVERDSGIPSTNPENTASDNFTTPDTPLDNLTPTASIDSLTPSQGGYPDNNFAAGSATTSSINHVAVGNKQDSATTVTSTYLHHPESGFNALVEASVAIPRAEVATESGGNGGNNRASSSSSVPLPSAAAMSTPNRVTEDHKSNHSHTTTNVIQNHNHTPGATPLSDSLSSRGKTTKSATRPASSSRGSRSSKFESDDAQDHLVVGSRVSPCFILRDLSGAKGNFFVFPEIGIRKSGFYRLTFHLFETSSLTREASTSLASVVSNVISVYPRKTFPGLSESTALSKCFAKQGIRIRLHQAFGDGAGDNDEDQGGDESDDE
ncbi:hypothetical protein HDU76_006524, partial [Blyttiomyces sp. JEL0837]